MTVAPQRVCGLAVACALAASATLAQDDGGGGTVLSADASFRLEFNDNPDLDPAGGPDETSQTTRLSFGLESRSRNQSLTAGLSGTYVARNGGDAVPGAFLGPDLRFAYERTGADSDLALSAQRSERDVRDSFALLVDPTDPLSPTDLIRDDGTVVSTALSARLRVGIAGPWGYEIGVESSQTAYQDTVSPDLEDEESRGVDVALRARLAPQLDARLTAALSETSSGDAVDTERRTTRAGLGLSYALDPVREIGLTAGVVQIETTRTLGALRDRVTEDGLSFGLTYLEARPRGTFSASLAQDFSVIGTLTTLQVGQQVALPLGTLDYSLGVSQTDGGDIAPVGRLTYSREGRTNRFGANIVAAVVPDDEDSVSSLSLGVTYGQTLTSSTSLSLSANFGQTRPLGDNTDPARQIASFEASVTRDLTRDWGVSAGYVGRLSQDEGADSAWSNGAFIQIGRSFSIRP